VATELPVGPSADGPGVAPATARGGQPPPAVAGGPESRRRASTDAASQTRGQDAALKFVGRVAQLDLDAVRTAVEAWRGLMREESGAWFTAEEVVARAVVVSGRRDVQKELLLHVAEAFAYGVWYGGGRRAASTPETPETRVQATEASGQYLATLAMLALLVRDHLAPAAFETLYRPFAPLIRLDELGPE
jgi:hypothetical protein